MQFERTTRQCKHLSFIGTFCITKIKISYNLIKLATFTFGTGCRRYGTGIYSFHPSHRRASWGAVLVLYFLLDAVGSRTRFADWSSRRDAVRRIRNRSFQASKEAVHNRYWPASSKIKCWPSIELYNYSYVSQVSYACSVSLLDWYSVQELESTGSKCLIALLALSALYSSHWWKC